MVKNILFVCKHNVFRSKVAEEFFNKFNKNKNYRASSAGIFQWEPKYLVSDLGFQAEKKVSRRYGLKTIGENSRGITASILKNTDILVIVADNVPPSLFEDKGFNKKGKKLLVWKITDVKLEDKNKEKIAENTIRFIEGKVKRFVTGLK